MINAIIRNEIHQRGLSVRKAAREIGVSHTTMFRIIKGSPIDLPTATKLSNWLNVPVSSLVDASTGNNSSEIEKIIFFLSLYPDLIQKLIQTIDQIQTNPNVTQAIADVLAYLVFRLSLLTGGQGEG